MAADDGRSTSGDPESRFREIEVWLDTWRSPESELGARARRRVRRMLSDRSIGWIDVDQVILAVAGTVALREQRPDLPPLEDRSAYAIAVIPEAIRELGGYPRKRRGEVENRPAAREVSLEDQLDKGVPVFRSAAHSADAQLAGVDLDQVRRHLAESILEPVGSGHSDARFTRRFEVAAALLYTAMFAVEPLRPDHFWPSGFPDPDPSEPTQDLHLRVALWLVDRNWFPAVPSADTERKRVTRAQRLLRTTADQVLGPLMRDCTQ